MFPGATAVAIGGVWLLIGAFVLLCNWFDWDVFLSFSEVDWRSWVLNREIPLWSYQLCTGITRLGDPQAFGLSPLFVVVLLFGPFWGTKLAVVLSMLVGLRATVLLLELAVSPPGQARVAPGPMYMLATLFVAGNYFLWHLLVGHFTFVSFYFALGIILYTLKAYLHGLDRKDLLLGSLITWQHYSGGFFHSTVFLLLPFFLAFGLLVMLPSGLALGGMAPGQRPRWRRVCDAAFFHLVGALLAFYKVIGVWSYQRGISRQLLEANETTSLAELLAYQVLPTVGPGWLVPLDTTGRWAVHEYSAFSLLPLVFLTLGGRLAWRHASGRNDSVSERLPRHPLTAFVIIYFIVSCALVLGEFSDYAPFVLINRYLFDDGLRVVGRFNVGVSLSIALATALLLRRSGPAMLGPRAVVLLAVVLAANILLSFSWMISVPLTSRLALLPHNTQGEVRVSRVSELFLPGARFERRNELDKAGTSQMYPILRAGEGVFNCYQALPHWRLATWPPTPVFPLIDVRFGSPDSNCVTESYATQNRIYIGPSCPQEICLNVTALNRYEPPPDIRHDPVRDRFCRVAQH